MSPHLKLLTHPVLQLPFILTLLFSQALFAGDDDGSTGVYEGKHFTVSYESGIKPLPLNQMHWWDLSILNKDGKPVTDASISIYGGMPAHHHGLPTQPEASTTGEGLYIIKGLKFSMTGEWEVWLDITAAGVKEKVVFKFTL